MLRGFDAYLQSFYVHIVERGKESHLGVLEEFGRHDFASNRRIWKGRCVGDGRQRCRRRQNRTWVLTPITTLLHPSSSVSVLQQEVEVGYSFPQPQFPRPSPRLLQGQKSGVKGVQGVSRLKHRRRGAIPKGTLFGHKKRRFGCDGSVHARTERVQRLGKMRLKLHDVVWERYCAGRGTSF